MLAKRIIACLDVKDGRTVKGVRFQELEDKGDPLALACRYRDAGADELVLLDVSATLEGRRAMRDVVSKVAAVLDIPFVVGGGIRTAEDALSYFEAGADKVSINSSAVEDPELISQIALECGSQAVVVAIDAARTADGWRVYTRSATRSAGLDAIAWAKEACERGAGEILLTSIDSDGVRNGFDCELTALVSRAVPVPLIASGGAGKIDHFIQVFQKGGADAALASGIFHDQLITIAEIKKRLNEVNIAVRL
jgi:cyclase